MKEGRNTLLAIGVLSFIVLSSAANSRGLATQHCAPGQYYNGTHCLKCTTENCNTCPNDQCKTCLSEYVLQNAQCILECKERQFNFLGQCKYCTDRNCLKCPSDICQECSEDFFLINGAVKGQCKYGAKMTFGGWGKPVVMRSSATNKRQIQIPLKMKSEKRIPMGFIMFLRIIIRSFVTGGLQDGTPVDLECTAKIEILPGVQGYFDCKSDETNDIAIPDEIENISFALDTENIPIELENIDDATGDVNATEKHQILLGEMFDLQVISSENGNKLSHYWKIKSTDSPITKSFTPIHFFFKMIPRYRRVLTEEHNLIVACKNIQNVEANTNATFSCLSEPSQNIPNSVSGVSKYYPINLTTSVDYITNSNFDDVKGMNIAKNSYYNSIGPQVNSSGGLSGGVIAAIAISSGVVLIAALTSLFMCRKTRRNVDFIDQSMTYSDFQTVY